jgi:hypothetical protein
MCYPHDGPANRLTIETERIREIFSFSHVVTLDRPPVWRGQSVRGLVSGAHPNGPQFAKGPHR